MAHEPDTPLPRGLHVSISQLSEETGRTRETISKRLAAADLTPSGTIRGAAVYRLRDALQVLFMGREDGSLDPDKLDPHSRHAHYKAEREKQSLAADAGELIPREQYRDEMARVAKLFAQTMDAIPDLLERDCAASPEMVQRAEAELDKLRGSLAEQLGAEEVPDGSDVREPPAGDARDQRDRPSTEADAAESGGDGIFAM